MGEFAARRAAYMSAIGEQAVLVLHSPPETLRNGDAHHRFRQSSDIYYLTGFSEADTTVVLRPGSKDAKFVMFVRPRDPAMETWNGRRAGIEGTKETFGADAAYPSSELSTRLPDLIADHEELHYTLGENPDADRAICEVIANLRRRERRGKKAPLRVVDPRTVLHEMRMRKSPAEIETLRNAARITAEGHLAAMKLARPGIAENELEAVVDYTFRRLGGTGPGYTTIVGAGDNANILHYIENNQPVGENALILIDAGCEYDFYTADVTRTFPANGKFTDAQRAVYSVVLSCQKEAVAMAKPGTTLDEIHAHCVRRLTEGMVELGLLAGDVSELIEKETYKAFYMHRTSHWLGMDVHDVGSYFDGDGSRPLEPGMVITIEPGLYIPLSSEAPEQFRGIGVRIEDDVLITATGGENLTAAIPKEVDDVESACSE